MQMINNLWLTCLSVSFVLLSCAAIPAVVEPAMEPVVESVVEPVAKTVTRTVLQPMLRPSKLISPDECWRQTKVVYGVTEMSVNAALDDKAEAFKVLVEENLSHRESAIENIYRLQEEGKTDGKKPLSGYDVNKLNEGFMDHLSLRTKLYEVVNDHICWLKPSEKKYQQLAMQPIADESRLKGIMLSLSAALVLYDNYLTMTSLLVENGKLRRFLNQKDRVYDKGLDELEKLTVSYNSEKKRRIAKQAIKYYEAQWERMPLRLASGEDFSYLNALIQQSLSYNMMKKSGGLGFIGRRLTFMGMVTNDDLLNLKNDGINLFSSLFGNTMGLVETRKGKLYNKPGVYSQVRNQLRAGDILLEKTPFRLTDNLIPGYWGHAAIWIGTEDELKELGIWNDPAVIPYHDKIRAGRSVIEALRSGVKMNSLKRFLNVDDLAVLRNPGADRGVQGKRMILALKQVGKAYDFNFNVETSDKIVCSELVYNVYSEIDWPTDKSLGRYTISPDHVAKKALSDDRFDLISLYHNGREVTSHRLETMAELIGEEVGL